jgi:hypothetical protein
VERITAKGGPTIFRRAGPDECSGARSPRFISWDDRGRRE